jgi:hypothetical protein
VFLEEAMTKEEKERYEGPELLRDILQRTLADKKFRLDCGHYVTWNHSLGNDVTIRNGKKLKIVCSLCSYWTLFFYAGYKCDQTFLITYLNV